MPHEQLKRQYEQDAEISTTPHLAWQFQHGNTVWEPATKRQSGPGKTTTDATHTPT